MGAESSQPEPEPQPQPRPEPEPTAPAAATGAEAGYVTVAVVCPAAAQAGQPVRITHGGQAFDVPVPPGVRAGQQFQVRLPAAAAAPGLQPGPSAGIYDGTAAYPGLRAAAAAAAARQAPPPTSESRVNKMAMTLAVAKGARLAGDELRLSLLCAVPARLSVWQAVAIAPAGAPPLTPVELGGAAAAGRAGEDALLEAGAAPQACAVTLALAEIRERCRGDAARCAAALCLQADPPPEGGQSVSALIVWLRFADEGQQQLAVVAQHLFTGAGGVLHLNDMYGLKGGGSDDAAGNDCVVCLEGAKDTAVLPCKHLCVCGSCAAQLDACPVCRGPVERYLKMVGLGAAQVGGAEAEPGPSPPSSSSAFADPELPFGGDLNAAMRAQDRDAIRELMQRRDAGAS